MSLVKNCLSHQLRCGLLNQYVMRVLLPDVAQIHGAAICNKKYTNEMARMKRFEQRLQKLLEKKKKKFLFDPKSPTQLGRMGSASPQTKLGKSMVGEDSIKLKTYNTLLHESIDDIIAEDLEDLQVSLLGVRLTGDLSTCRVYWQASGNYQEDQKIQDVLDLYAGKLRYKLINLRVLSRIPQIAFLQERTAAKIAEVDRLLELADIPPDNAEEDVELTEIGVTDASQELEPVFGLDQTEINKQILRMKKHQQRQELEQTRTGDSLDKFRSSIKRRKKGREKALYSLEEPPSDDFSVYEGYRNGDDESIGANGAYESELDDELDDDDGALK